MRAWISKPDVYKRQAQDGALVPGMGVDLERPGRGRRRDRRDTVFQYHHVDVYKRQLQLVMGYRDEVFLCKDLRRYGRLTVATEDGSAGTKGNVLDAIRENDLAADLIYACGPSPMLRALKQYAEKEGIPCYISLEERMRCV